VVSCPPPINDRRSKKDDIVEGIVRDHVDAEKTGDIDARYERRRDQYAEQLQQLRRRDVVLSTARGITLIVTALVVILAWGDGFSMWVVVLPVLVFLALAVWHEQVLGGMVECSALHTIYVRHLARRHRRWEELPELAVPIPEHRRAVARDLDVFGPRSMFQWLCVAHTPMGRRLLAEWLIEPADPKTIQQRQPLVAALAAEEDWREQLQLHGSLLGSSPTSSEQFVAWATGGAWLAHRRWLLWFARAVPVLLAALLAALLSGWMTGEAAAGLAIVLLLANGSLSVLYTGGIHEIFDQVTGRSHQVLRYRQMLEIANRLPDRVGPLTMNGGDIRDVARGSLVGLASLLRVLRLANARRDGLFGLMFLLAQLVFLWEFHLLELLERWQRRWGRAAPAWFSVIAHLEALASLATAAHDHPSWTFPEINRDAATFNAVQLGHPLLSNERRVSNDVAIGPTGTFLLVTGSNMSGKSTLLRSVGLNVLLAQAGGVVCAKQLVMPPLRVETSMRVSDSLSDGVSFFLAELLRLKQIVDQAHHGGDEPGRLLYLLDEILQGTNSRERQLAVIRVIGYLMQQGAIGAVSTHDLELATSPQLAAACRVVHFRETLTQEGEQRAMTFDYRLRPGLAPTSNALILLDMVGLPAE
jgi:hypothetical protein